MSYRNVHSQTRIQSPHSHHFLIGPHMAWESKPVYGVGQMNYPAYSLILWIKHIMISWVWHNWPTNKWTAICSKLLFLQHHCSWVHFWTLRTKHLQVFQFNSIVPDMLNCYSLCLRWSNIIRSDGICVYICVVSCLYIRPMASLLNCAKNNWFTHNMYTF